MALVKRKLHGAWLKKLHLRVQTLNTAKVQLSPCSSTGCISLVTTSSNIAAAQSSRVAFNPMLLYVCDDSFLPRSAFHQAKKMCLCHDIGCCPTALHMLCRWHMQICQNHASCRCSILLSTCTSHPRTDLQQSCQLQAAL